MHPDDEAELVAAEVEELRARLAAAPSLRAGAPQLTNRFELRIPLVKPVYRQAMRGVDLPIRFIPCRQCGGELVHRSYTITVGQPIDRELVLFSDCSGYDARAITAELRLPNDEPLPDREWPQDFGPNAIIHGFAELGRPFFCRRGLREFHAYPQHQDVPWDMWRERARIYQVIPELLYDLQTRWAIG